MSRNPDVPPSSRQASGSNLISRQALELTMVLLRSKNPSLATAIRQTLLELKTVTAQNTHPSPKDNLHLYPELLKWLDAETISAIIAELNLVAQRTLNKNVLYPEAKAVMSQLLQEWADLIEWVLLNSTIERRQHY